MKFIFNAAILCVAAASFFIYMKSKKKNDPIDISVLKNTNPEIKRKTDDLSREALVIDNQLSSPRTKQEPRPETDTPRSFSKENELRQTQDSQSLGSSGESDLQAEVLGEDEISPKTIYNAEKYSAEEVQTKFESSLRSLESVSNTAKIEQIECSQKKCQMILSEKLPDQTQADLYSYYLDHPQFGKYIHSDRSKDDPQKIIYTFSDELTFDIK